MENVMLYRITAKDVLWTDCPPVTITFVAENRHDRWVRWLEDNDYELDGATVGQEPHIVHQAWQPSALPGGWSKLDSYFWSQSNDFANQMFTFKEMNALKSYIERHYKEVAVESITLPLKEAMRPLDATGLRSRTIFKMEISDAVVRFNDCDFYCDVMGYYDQHEYQESETLARLMPRRSSPIQQRLSIQYNPDADAFYYIIEDDHMIYEMSLPEFPTQEAAISAARQKMF